MSAIVTKPPCNVAEHPVFLVVILRGDSLPPYKPSVISDTTPRVSQHDLATERQRAIAFAGQSCECVHDCRRDYGNWWFAAAGWRFGARHDVNVNGHRRVDM